MTTDRIGVVSPDPEERTQGLEKFCHMLSDALVSRGLDSKVVGIDHDLEGFDLVVTNGIFGPYRTTAPRLHVYHGTAPKQVAVKDSTISRRWRAKSMLEKSIREIRGGTGATRVAVSPSVQRELRRFYRFSSDVVLNAVDTTVFKPRDRAESRRELGLDPDARLALFAGRPESRKLPDYAVAAASATGHRLLLAAGRPHPDMEWIGRLDEQQLTRAMAAVDVVYLPSQYEANSLIVLEALAVGTPVVTTAVGWVPDLVEAVPEFRPFAPSHKSKDDFVRAAMLQSADPGAAAAMTRLASEYVRATVNLDRFADAWAHKIRSTLA